MKPLRPMLGRTAVVLVFVEGPGSAAMDDRTRIAWYAEAAAAQGVLGRLGADWGARRQPPVAAPCSFALSGTRATIGLDPRALPPRTGDKRRDWKQIDQLWLDQALTALGVPAGASFDDRMRQVGAGLSVTGWFWLGLDEILPVFVTNYPTFWEAYADEHGRYAVINVPEVRRLHGGTEHRVIAHELGHLFGAPDEYADSTCTVLDTAGPFGTVNANCTFVSRTPPIPNPLSRPCLMRDNEVAACTTTELMWGWADSDGNGTPDLVEDPVVSSIDEMGPAPGEVITLTGRNMWDVVQVEFGSTLTSDLWYVTVNGASTPFAEADGTTKYRTDQIQVRVPAGLDGIQMVRVRTRGAWSPADDSVFVAVTHPHPPLDTDPVVQELSPILGPPGTSVTIKGEHLARVTSVTVGGVPATDVEAWTGATVTFTVPRLPFGPAQVVASTPTASSTPWAFSLFTVT